jgi:5-deoxy-glucuronate isomerase
MSDGRIALRDCHYRVRRERGLQPVQLREPGRARLLSSRRLCLGASERFDVCLDGEETVLVLQQGRARLDLDDGRCVEIARKSVFEERASAIYLPPGCEVSVHAESELELIAVSTPARHSGHAHVVRPEQVRATARGGPGYTREVHDILVDDAHARHLMAGETFNPAGGWSSFPPHKHDGRNGEPALEEVYHFRLDPPGGFGIQRLYAEGQETCFSVEDGDCVLIPYGYHPVAAPPGYRLYYLWVLAGPERRLALHTDPRHAWIDR